MTLWLKMSHSCFYSMICIYVGADFTFFFASLHSPTKITSHVFTGHFQMTAMKVSQLCLDYKAPDLHRPLPSVTAEYNLLEYSH